MNKVILKIKRNYFQDIMNGKKIYEVRKLNKNYIKINDIVTFIDMENEDILGRLKVKAKFYLQKQELKALLVHKGTLDFIDKNYKDINRFIVFRF